MKDVRRRGFVALVLAQAAGGSLAVSSADGDDQALLADADDRAGLRLSWRDRWLHVRPSGTEPIVRLIAEAPTTTDAEALIGAASKAGDAAAALARFESALKRFPDAADLHNELGFAHRHLRQFDKAFEHYKRALAINPQHRGAHEYIGEAYLMVGDVPAAEQHLAALRSICVLPCEELKDLEKAVAGYRERGSVR